MPSEPATEDGPRTADALTSTEREFQTAHRRAFEATGLAVDSRFVDLEHPRTRLHVVEAGPSDDDPDPPLVFVHGVMSFAAMFAPLTGYLADRRLIAFDRPGWGLSSDHRYEAATHRETAVDVLEGLLDALAVETVDIVGHSSGGYWGLVFALAHPERVRRVVAVGGVPAIPGTSPPTTFRLFTIPFLPRLLLPRGHPTAETVVEQLALVGEHRTIREYPELVTARVAHDRLPRALPSAIAEIRSFLSVLGWRDAVTLSADALRSMPRPTTFVWGETDFLGSPEAVRPTVESMPDARLETLPAGHIPWLGHPETCAEAAAPGQV
jgi:pimeloyl-ACP methyl ester carboxylesterase